MRIHMAEFIAALLKRRIHDVLGVHVLKDGEPVGEFYWNDCFERPHNINSCSKSVTSLAIGMAIGEGMVNLDEKIADIFPEKLPPNIQQWWLDVTIRDMLTMTIGHDVTPLPRNSRDTMPNTDWLDSIFNLPLTYKPGAHFLYNNAGPYLCSRLIKKRGKESLLNWLKPRLFDPLNIKNPQWFTCPQGHTLGIGALFLTPKQMADIGQVCLNRGEWNGKQLIPAAYIDEATSCQFKKSNMSSSPTTDFQVGYGYYFWRNAQFDSYRANGSGAQLMIVLPKQNAVVSVISSNAPEQEVLDAVWEGIVPQLQ